MFDCNLMLVFHAPVPRVIHGLRNVLNILPWPQELVGNVISTIPYLFDRQVYCLAFEEELTVPLKYLSLFITP